MSLFNANLIIRETRKAQGLTQEQLAEGICSRETVVKVEKGERKPNWFVMKELMLKLGLDAELYQDEMTSENDVAIFRKWSECTRLLATHKCDEAKEEIDLMESSDAWKTELGYKILLHLKAGLFSLGNPLFVNNYYNPESAVECALKCLRLTRNDFDVDKIPEYFLSTNEYILLNFLALAYDGLGKIDKTIELWVQIKANLEKKHVARGGGKFNNWYEGILHNMAITLERAGRYDECLNATREGLIFTQRTHNMLLHQSYMALRAMCLMKLERIEEGQEAHKKLMMFRYAVDGHPGIPSYEQGQKWYEELYGEKLELEAKHGTV